MSQTVTAGLSRRGVLASVLAATTAAALPVMASAAPHAQDAALLALSDAFWQVHNEIWSADYLAEHEPGSPEQKRLEAILDQLSEQEYGLMKQISQTPARSQLGLKGKADILLAVLPEVMRDCYLNEDSAELLLVMSLLQDMTGITQI
ncbi:hypothetical protein [Acetobacter oryzoeni]|uniref:Twin-arginine translocation signal domain-containing protein n=1 Tax=Acetobacter oryzoeni TaxID=2500548 RepID=A0A5B9GDZ3_9PROT|nr:hypothetical protein [Acetobacter oryzoeni]MCP1203172.1 hypothetical protein [Acetobacter oryzoeni]QEE84232.1 hypothetical protein EOV40_000105 [Acetobacter oryzoeni]